MSSLVAIHSCFEFFKPPPKHSWYTWDTDKQCKKKKNFSKAKIGLRTSESLDRIVSILECVLNLFQSFYEEKFCWVGMKFSKSTFAPSFLGHKFCKNFCKRFFFIKWLGKVRNAFCDRKFWVKRLSNGILRWKCSYLNACLSVFKWTYPYFNELIRGFTINSITLSVIRILEPSFAVKESFAYPYHEHFLFKITFKVS